MSGVKPSGELHIGNYLGAVKQWVDLQSRYSSYIFIADLHAITEPQKPENLSSQTLELAADYIALGIDPEKSVFFVQSQVAEHTQLMWILNTITAMGDLERMIEYKEKISEGKEALAGLFTYPILIASDILLYKPTVVPVGEDQRQHVELTRELARRFNKRFGEVFPLPKELVLKEGGRIMSLQEPSKKMSKSHGKLSYIAISDSGDQIRKKIKSAVTDSGSEIVFDKEKKPALANLLTIYHRFSDLDIDTIEKEFANTSYKDFKEALAEVVVEKLKPVQEKRSELLENKQKLIDILGEGSAKAREKASATLKEVYEKVGLTPQ